MMMMEFPLGITCELRPRTSHCEPSSQLWDLDDDPPWSAVAHNNTSVFESCIGTIAQWPWASYLHPCASITKQYNLVQAKAGE